MSPIAVSANSTIAADAGARVADEGGNAVDAAIASLLVSLVTEPGICSLGGGAFVTILPPDGNPVTVDGYVEMPGRGLHPDRFGGGVRHVHLGYGGGVETTVGHGSVATPGTLAALGAAWDNYGRIAWNRLIEPAYEWALEGFPLSPSSRLYFGFSGEPIFGWHPESRKTLFGTDNELPEPGEPLRMPDLAWSLGRIAETGPDELYRGEVARRIARELEAHGGILTLRDLEAYQPMIRTPLQVDMDGWTLATNPPPAVGGATLTAMLHLMDGHPTGEWDTKEVQYLARVQEIVFNYRQARLDPAEDVEKAVLRLLSPDVLEQLRREVSAPSTVHVSAVGADGLACAITASTGYGSGVMPPGTGIWLNNCLGERELNRKGLHALPPGTRLSSNMAPSVARGLGGEALAIGTPGADRITSALVQTLVNFFTLGMSLEEAVAHPRLHVEQSEDGPRVAHEPGLPVQAVQLPVRPFDALDMFFGGVGAALYRPGKGVIAAADPRRAGGIAVGAIAP